MRDRETEVGERGRETERERRKREMGREKHHEARIRFRVTQEKGAEEDFQQGLRYVLSNLPS